MVTVDLFRLSKPGQLVGHVRILHDGERVYYAIISYQNPTPPPDENNDFDTTTSHRLQAPSYREIVEAVTDWSGSHFGNDCVLKPLHSNLWRTVTA